MRRQRPAGFDKIELGAEQIDALDRVATSIFADRVKAGDTMGAALATVYLSGLQHGGAIIGKWSAAPGIDARSDETPLGGSTPKGREPGPRSGGAQDPAPPPPPYPPRSSSDGS